MLANDIRSGDSRVLVLDYARSRLQAFLDELAHIEEGEFPYVHSKAALEQLARLFRKKLGRLESLDKSSDPDVVRQECALALRALFIYLPVLGFILRSTNLRNAFEVFGPLLRLARAILEPEFPVRERKTKLVLSSEWDYSPFTYPEITELPGFVLIGLPAPESGNPLLIPLAGHELGHSVWLKKKISVSLQAIVSAAVAAIIKERWKEYSNIFRPGAAITPEDLTTDLVVLQTWRRAVDWTLRQAEETFCDFVGVRLFGPAYLQAFAYLLSPNTGTSRPVHYPAMRTRIRNLVAATQQYTMTVPTDYEDLFTDSPRISLDAAGTFLSDVADDALLRLVGSLVSKADDSINGTGIEKPAEAEILRILARFRQVVPVETAASLGDIVNAAWRAHLDVDFWKELPQVNTVKDRVLKELTLKNIEVFEIEQILKEPR
jgi:hypothetical protein